MDYVTHWLNMVAGMVDYSSEEDSIQIIVTNQLSQYWEHQSCLPIPDLHILYQIGVRIE